MICKDFEKLIHLYLDQKLDEQKRKEVEKHLSECQKCREKFETLKLVEEKAKEIKIPEPGDAYWESFSQRVRQKIVSKQKQPFGAKLKEFASNIFVFTPARLRVAAAVVSIILVFIVGKLYIDYRGTIPERVKPAEKEIPKADKREIAFEEPRIEEEKRIPAPKKGAPIEEKKDVVGKKEPEITKEKLAISEKAELKEIEAGKGAELMTKKPPARDIGKVAPVPEIAEQEVLKPVEKEVVLKAPMRAMADVEEKKAKPRSKIMCVDIIGEGDAEGHTIMCSMPDGTKIPDIDYNHGVLSTDSLRVIRDFWSKFLKDNPEDDAVERAYLQIAASYYHIFNKTKDEVIRVEGIKQIEEFLKISTKEKTKENLRQRLENLKSLKAKPRSKVLCEGEAILSEGQTKRTTTRYSLPDGTKLPDVDYRQKELSANFLRFIIDFWSEFIKDNPDDTFVESAYLQIAAAYYYLFEKTKDEAIREKGIKQIKEFLKISQKEETKEELKQRLEKLEGLKEK
jgi:hypothetical protein